MTKINLLLSTTLGLLANILTTPANYLTLTSDSISE